MPMSLEFEARLHPHLRKIVERYGTPFHIYDEQGIRDTARAMNEAFAGCPDYRNFFAVKALPNPDIMKILFEEGFGFDCSSIPELVLSRVLKAGRDDIMFTSNNTMPHEFDAAFANSGCILNLDDVTLIDKMPQLPEVLCFRYNPGKARSGNAIIGEPQEAKYGITDDQVIDAYRRGLELGVKRFGIHTMIVSNERDFRELLKTVQMMLQLAALLYEELGIKLEFANIGGGVGIPYQPTQESFNLTALGKLSAGVFEKFEKDFGFVPRLYSESGRYVTGPHGVLVSTVTNVKHTHREYRQMDACMSSLMRPALYDAYHHITVLDKDDSGGTEVVDVVGSLCENNDKFAKQRELPILTVGDIVMFHDSGAHGHAMGFNYNGRLRPTELLLCIDGTVKLIRRAETIEDHFRTLAFEQNILTL